MAAISAAREGSSKLRTSLSKSPGSAYLLALADDIEELKNICSCGKKATMNVRVDEAGRRIRGFSHLDSLIQVTRCR